MSGGALPNKAPGRQVMLGALALAVVLVPDQAFSIVTTVSWQLTILRLLGLIGVAVVAVLPWAHAATSEIRRRLRRWSVPGSLATAIYVLSGDPLYLVIGFCLLAGAAIDMWLTRAHLADEAMSDRLTDR